MLPLRQLVGGKIRYYYTFISYRFLILSGGRRKLHYLYPDQTELVEELDLNTNEVLSNL